MLPIFIIGGDNMANSNVKCRACGNIIDKTTAFCASKGQYYCNQEEYDTKKQLYSILSEYINTTNTILHKEMMLWGTDYKKICNYLQDNRSLFEYAMKKDFNSEYAKIRYFSAIIKNGINDYQPPKPEIIKQCTDEFYEKKYKPKTRRKCLADYYEEEL